MKLDLQRLDVICWMLIPVILILGIIAGDKELNIYLNDTIYVIDYKYLSVVSLILTCVLGFIYRSLILKNTAVNKKFFGLPLTLVIIGMLVLLMIAAVTGALTQGSQLSMDWEGSYTFIVAIIAAFIMTMIGVILLISTLFKNIIYK